MRGWRGCSSRARESCGRLPVQCGGLDPSSTHPSAGFQQCVCPQDGHSSGTAIEGNDSKTTVSVSSPVGTNSPVTGPRIKISGTQNVLLKTRPAFLKRRLRVASCEFTPEICYLPPTAFASLILLPNVQQARK
jgi:hypothetical protein